MVSDVPKFTAASRGPPCNSTASCYISYGPMGIDVKKDVEIKISLKKVIFIFPHLWEGVPLEESHLRSVRVR